MTIVGGRPVVTYWILAITTAVSLLQLIPGVGNMITDALDFLWKTQNEEGHTFGKRVAVVGAGDVAMDCVRTAARWPGVEVAELVYRRTEPFMPATQHEVNTVRAEGHPCDGSAYVESSASVTVRVE